MRLGRSLLLALALTCIGAPASARGNHFTGAHPIATKYGGGYCYIDAPHLHAYAPERPQLYQKVGDDYVFTADPTPFGYEGDKHPFYGNHPVVTVGGEPVFCYLDGPHYHPFAAPDVPDYKVERGVAFYVGPQPPAYVKLRPQRRKAVNAEYRPYLAMRPTIEVTPPPQWQGEVWVAPPAVEVQAPGVAVRGPGVAVSAPGVYASTPGVVVSAPGVYVNGPGVVVAGPRVHVGVPGVVVTSPGVAVEGGVYVEGGRRHHDGHHDGDRDDDRDDNSHRDNGRHRGGGKHGR